MTVFLSDMTDLPTYAQLEDSFLSAVQRDFAVQPVKPDIYVKENGRKRFWAEVNQELICGIICPNGIPVSDLPAVRKEWEELEGCLSRHIHLYFFIPRFDHSLRGILEKESYYAARFATTGVARTVRVLQYMKAGPEVIALRELVTCTIYAAPSVNPSRQGRRSGGQQAEKAPFLFFTESKLSEDELVDFLELGMEIRSLVHNREVISAPLGT